MFDSAPLSLKRSGAFERAKGQYWKRTELGFEMPFKTITGGIFEVGFPDLIQQMWRRF